MMSSVRAANYRDQLLQVIDTYMDAEKQNNEKSAGVRRARSLKTTVEVQLLAVEKLTDRQLIWRVLDYAGMEHGTGPLQTSSILRLRILEDLCETLLISEKAIKHECELALCRELQMHMSPLSPPGIFYFEDKNDIKKTAMLTLIKKNLKRIYSYDDRLASMLVQHVTGAINEYIDKESVRYFGDANARQARAVLETIRVQWVMHENLNENQMLWRLHEQLILPHGEGIFGCNAALRQNIAGALCRFLHCDEKKIAADVDLRTGPSHFRHSWFGPVFIPATDGSIYYDVCCRHIAMRLKDQSPKMDHPYEMRSFAKYA